MRLQLLRRTLEDPEQLAMLTEAESAVQLSISRLRHLVFELHPPGLEQEGLSAALSIALDAQRDSGVDFRFDDRLTAQPPTEMCAHPLSHRAGGARERARRTPARPRSR